MRYFRAAALGASMASRGRALWQRLLSSPSLWILRYSECGEASLDVVDRSYEKPALFTVPCCLLEFLAAGRRPLSVRLCEVLEM